MQRTATLMLAVHVLLDMCILLCICQQLSQMAQRMYVECRVVRSSRPSQFSVVREAGRTVQRGEGECCLGFGFELNSAAHRSIGIMRVCCCRALLSQHHMVLSVLCNTSAAVAGQHETATQQSVCQQQGMIAHPLIPQEGSTSLGFQALNPKLVGFVLCLGFQALNPKLMGFVWGHAAHACWRICCFLRVEGECERVECKPQPMCTRFPFPHNSDKAKACKS